MISDLALSALWFGAGAAAAWKLTALHYRSRLSEARASANLFKEWWIRDSGEMLVLQAERDLRRQQHIDSGKLSHRAEREHIRETTDWLSSLPPQPLRPRHEIEAEVAAIRAARKQGPLDAGRGVCPVSGPAREVQPPPAPLSNSCRGSAARSQDRIGKEAARSGRQDAGSSLCRRGQSLPAEPPEKKGASHG